MDTRKIVVDEKEKFVETMVYEHAIRSAVARGFYHFLGGKKSIALPNFCDIITEVTQKVLKAKELYDKKSDRLDGEYSSELSRAFRASGNADLIEDIEFGFEVEEVDGEEQWNMVVTDFISGRREIIKKAGRMEFKTLVNLTEKLLSIYGDQEVLESIAVVRIAFGEYYSQFY